MSGWRWVRRGLVYAVHEVQLARHGGLDGLRDQNAVESALARPEQLNFYEAIHHPMQRNWRLHMSTAWCAITGSAMATSAPPGWWPVSS